MSYASVETALDTILKTVSGYSSTNIAKGDYRILGRGNIKVIILNPGAFRRANMAPGVQETEWTINLELLIQFTDEISTIASSIRTERQNIIDKIDAYPTLNKATGVLLGAIDTGDEPEVWLIGSKKWWRQIMRVVIKEYTATASAE